MKKRTAIALAKKYWPEILFLISAFLFSWWLMWHTFDYKNGQILIASKAWSDFAANIPLIRSFSWGQNWPPEYPLFSGEPIKYHFLFYFLVGNLEKLGLPLSWALNLPSLIGFWALLIIIYYSAKLVFEKRGVALLSVAFFLFNSSLSFLEFFKRYPLSLNTLKNIASNTTFPSFGPYDGNIISAFWNLNIYTNQRHLASAYFIVLLITYCLIRSAKSSQKLHLWQIFLLGSVVGFLPFFHKACFLMTGVVLASFFIYFQQLRKPILAIGLIALGLAIPQFAYQMNGTIYNVQFRPGYLVSPPLTFLKIVSYWFLNLGLSLILIPASFIFANKLAKKLFLAFLPLFFIGNLFQFSPEIAANHKFFNLFIIIGNILMAWLIYLFWRKNIFGKIVALVLILCLTLSGIIDFFPIKNDLMYTLEDAPRNPDILWIKENTPPGAIILNSSYFYHPASLAGRKIFYGWPYFTWGIGYDLRKKETLIKSVYEGVDKKTVCSYLIEARVDYFTVEWIDKDIWPAIINFAFFNKNFQYAYSNPTKQFMLYDVRLNCPEAF